MTCDPKELKIRFAADGYLNWLKAWEDEDEKGSDAMDFKGPKSERERHRK